MPDRLRFHPQVVADLEQATAWYDRISLDVGSRFRLQLNSRFDDIEERPTFFPSAFGEVRFAIVRRFPYLVLFRLHGDVSFVIGVFHSASDPAKWQQRDADTR